MVCISCFRRCLSRAIAAWLYCDCDRGGLLDCAFEEARRREGAVPRAESKAGAVDAHCVSEAPDDWPPLVVVVVVVVVLLLLLLLLLLLCFAEVPPSPLSLSELAAVDDGLLPRPLPPPPPSLLLLPRPLLLPPLPPASPPPRRAEKDCVEDACDEDDSGRVWPPRDWEKDVEDAAAEAAVELESEGRPLAPPGRDHDGRRAPPPRLSVRPAPLSSPLLLPRLPPRLLPRLSPLLLPLPPRDDERDCECCDGAESPAGAAGSLSRRSSGSCLIEGTGIVPASICCTFSSASRCASVRRMAAICLVRYGRMPPPPLARSDAERSSPPARARRKRSLGARGIWSTRRRGNEDTSIADMLRAARRRGGWHSLRTCTCSLETFSGFQTRFALLPARTAHKSVH